MVESSAHVLCDCPMASSVWNSIVDPKHSWTFYGLNFNDWIQANLSNLFDTGGDITWCYIWAVTSWKIWSWRNTDTHKDNFKRPHTPVEVVRQVILDYDIGKTVLCCDLPRLP